MKRAWNPWLEHLNPETDSDSNHARDTVRLFIEQHVSSLTHRLITEANLEAKDAAAYAANLMVSQALAVQREASPEGYRLMVSSLAVEDPALSDLRSDILTIIQRRATVAFRVGMFAAFSVSFLSVMIDPAMAMIIIGIASVFSLALLVKSALRKK